MITYKVGQVYKLFNGETITIKDVSNQSGLGSDNIWRTKNGFSGVPGYDLSELIHNPMLNEPKVEALE